MSNKSKINKIKIFGERNSGTNFLSQLIKNNVKEINILSSYYNGGSGWKHGFPKLELFDDINSTLFIFIIRDLNTWIKSMYFNNYHYIKPTNINDFINSKLHIKDNRVDHDVNVNINENDTLINLRNNKITNYLHFFKNVNNVMFINLEDLQNNNKKFLKFLRNIYKLEITKYRPVLKHTKNKKNKKNRSYDLTIPKVIENKNHELEEFVKNLKTNYYYKFLH
jgi:hypothetical protein